RRRAGRRRADHGGRASEQGELRLGRAGEKGERQEGQCETESGQATSSSDALDAERAAARGVPGYRASTPRWIDSTPVRDTSIRPSGRIRSTKLSIFDGAPVSSKTKLSWVVSITLARKISD